MMSSTSDSVNMPKFRSKASAGSRDEWSIHSINTRFIFASQQWATICLTLIFAVIPVGLVHWLPAAAPRHRPAYMYDATISYPMADHDSVPAWASYSIPFILFIITVCVGELLLSKSMHSNVTNALTAVLHFTVDAISAFFVALLVQTATKAAIGRLRPDFLDRCKPAAGVNGKYAFQLSIASEADPNCTETDQSLLKDGRSSFPSGHANMSAVLCTYTAGYFLWTIYTRHRSSVFGAFDERKGWWHFLWKDFCHAVAMYWILLMLGLSWAIAGSRIVDNKHNPSDVVAGFFLGASVAVVFLLRSIPCLKFIPRYNAQTEEAEFLRGGEADVADNRLPEQELAELGQNHGTHSNGPSHGANAVHPHPRSSKTSLGVQHSIALN